MSGQEEKNDFVGAEHGDGAVAGPSGLDRRRDTDGHAGPQSPRPAQPENVERENESAESRDTLPSYGESDHDNVVFHFRERPWENFLLTPEHRSSSSTESDPVQSVPVPGPHAQPGPSRDRRSPDRRPPRLSYWTMSSPVRPDYARYLFSYMNQDRNGIVHRNMGTYVRGAHAEHIRRQLMLPRTLDFDEADEWPDRQQQVEQPQEERGPEQSAAESDASTSAPEVTRDRFRRRNRSEDRESVRDRSRHRERRLSESPDGRAGQNPRE